MDLFSTVLFSNIQCLPSHSTLSLLAVTILKLSFEHVRVVYRSTRLPLRLCFPGPGHARNKSHGPWICHNVHTQRNGLPGKIAQLIENFVCWSQKKIKLIYIYTYINFSTFCFALKNAEHLLWEKIALPLGQLVPECRWPQQASTGEGLWCQNCKQRHIPLKQKGNKSTQKNVYM